jgi:hypothetical protein
LYSDDGTTWNNANLAAGYYASALVEWEGRVLVFGNASGSGKAFTASWNGSSWTVQALIDFNGVVSFSRLAVKVGPALMVVATSATTSTANGYLIAFRSYDGYYQIVGSIAKIGSAFWTSAAQAQSPGGVHAIADSTDGDILRIYNGL